MSDLTAGVVGLGEMGTPISRHWLTDGFDVHVFDIDDEKVANLESEGAVAEDSPEAVAAACDATLVIVGTGEQVTDVITGEDGVSDGLGDGDVVIVSSTVHPDRVKQLGEEIPEEAHIVDAPFGRGRYIEDRDTVVFAGGDDEAVTRVRPLLESFGEAGVFHLGAPGSGQMGKTVNNMLLWACHSANYEAFRLAESYGIDHDHLRDAIIAGSGNNFALEERWGKSTGKWAEDDLRIVSELADRFDIVLPQTERTKGLMQSFNVSSQGMGEIWKLSEPQTASRPEYDDSEHSLEYPGVTEEELEGTDGYDI
jgi:3-hydroxyisobutyrate dehydrogenase-like beta-hydroxyacid dehydrogenase